MTTIVPNFCTIVCFENNRVKITKNYKNIQINEKGDKTKVRFYRIQPIEKPESDIPSANKFYKLVYDKHRPAGSRNVPRQVKRDGPPIVSPPAKKKIKVLLSFKERGIPPTTPSELYNVLTELYQETFGGPIPSNIRLWTTYHHDRQPTPGMANFEPMETMDDVDATPNNTVDCNVYDPTLYTPVFKVQLSRLNASYDFVRGLKNLVKKKRNCPTDETRKIFAALQASCPQVSREVFSRIVAASRYCFIREIENEVGFKVDWLGVSMDHCANCSPSPRVVTDWAKLLARDQMMRIGLVIKNCGNVCTIQSDGGPTKQDPTLLNVWNPHNTTDTVDGTLEEYWRCLLKSSRGS